MKRDRQPISSTSTQRSDASQLQNEDREENLHLNKLYMSCMIFFSVIGGFLFGYDTSVIAGANLFVKDDFPTYTDFQKELVVSMTLLGAAIGSLTGGPISDKFGRKITILVADAAFCTGCVIMAFTPSIFILVVGRFVVGIGVGVAAMVVPVYIAEISPKNIRGVLVNLNVVFIASGQFLALVICLLLGKNWRYMLGLAGIPALLQGIGILFMSESPRWLFKNSRESDAIEALERIYSEPLERLFGIIEEQREEANKVKQYENYPYKELIKQSFSKYSRCLFVGCGLQMFQQLCGINTAMYYGPDIMQAAGFGDENNRKVTLLSSLPLAFVNAMGGVIALTFIDRMGRRWILLRTLPFVALFMGFIGIGMGFRNHTNENQDISQNFGGWLAAGGIFLYLMAFSIGMGPTPWTVNSEIYPLHLRGVCNSLSATTNWVSNFAVSFSFLTLLNHVPYGDIFAFLLILLFAAMAFLFVFIFLPETKGMSLNKVLELFIKDKKEILESEDE
ncbi:unnamed protein product [Moneuplotes crassus]|uniref:Hexose transporter 1 n=2 Tax=Euplotes crassus TaxID=5936 RepID=A0AAD1XDE5_EUPCR|nr:unnamed protein product [Moneuplotes crassus]